MNKFILFGFVVLVSLVSVNAFYIGNERITIGIISDTEMPVATISQLNLTFNSSSYAHPSGRIFNDKFISQLHPSGRTLNDNFIFILGSLKSYLEDFERPEYQDIVVYPRLAYTNQPVTISALTLDNVHIMEEWVNITFPDSTSITNSTPYPYHLTPFQNGNYSVQFYAKDTSNNLRIPPSVSIKVIDPSDLNVNLRTHPLNQTTSLNLYYDETFSKRIILENVTNKTLPGTTYDATFSSFSDTVQLRYVDFNVSNISSINVSFDKITNHSVFNSIYHVGSNHNLTGAITVSYSGVANDNYLSFHRCNDWDFIKRECFANWWVSIPFYQDKDNNKITIFQDDMNMNFAYAINQESFCGDGVCDPNENCEICQEDCGVCPINQTMSGITGVSLTPRNPDDIVLNHYYMYVDEYTGIDLDVYGYNIPLNKIRAKISDGLHDVHIQIKSLVDQELRRSDIPLLSEQINDSVSYSYVIISHENIDEAKILESEFTFTIPKQWYLDNNLTSEDTKIYKYVDGFWTEMEITEIKSVGFAYTVTIKSDGFSLFSIGGVKSRFHEKVVDGYYISSDADIGVDVVEEELMSGRKEIQYNWLFYFVLIFVIGLFSVIKMHKNHKDE